MTERMKIAKSTRIINIGDTRRLQISFEHLCCLVRHRKSLGVGLGSGSEFCEPVVGQDGQVVEVDHAIGELQCNHSAVITIGQPGIYRIRVHLVPPVQLSPNPIGPKLFARRRRTCVICRAGDLLCASS